MRVINLTPENKCLYYVCLEPWSKEMKEAGDHKSIWYENYKDKGLRVKLIEDDNGVISGMIQYIPIQHSFIQGEDLYVILCIWVHGHKEGIGDQRFKGMGKKLLEAAEKDVSELGAKGIVAWGLIIPAFMRASWFKKQGYEKVARSGITQLMWKKFSSDAIKPRFINPKKKPKKQKGQVTIYAYKNGWCPAINISYERAKKASLSFEEKVVFKEFDTTNRSIFLEWGIMDAIFIDNKQVRTEPPPTYEKICKLIKKRVDRL